LQILVYASLINICTVQSQLLCKDARRSHAAVQ